EAATERAVEAARLQPTKRGPVAVLKLGGVADRDGADTLRRQNVYATEGDIPLAEGEVYLHDLVGMAVVVEGAAEPIGTVADVVRGVAQDLLVVERPGQPDALVPDVEEIVVGFDAEARRLTIDPPEGLLD
ncbi:MAG: ribosome maturation factor RimM, partial [Rhodothermales bacterium]|nr:ribosome maturation factor RimM [Rhodothermales bacterium]